MDPVTALGFASTIITFVDFGYKIVTGSIEVLEKGSTSENATLEDVTKDLVKVAKQLSEAPTGNSEHVRNLRELGSKCQELASELLVLLRSLKLEEGSSKINAVRIAVRSIRKKGKVEELERRLDTYRRQAMTRLLLILNDPNRDLAVRLQLAEFQAQAQSQSNTVLERLDNIREEIFSALDNTGHRNEHQNPAENTKTENSPVTPSTEQPESDQEFLSLKGQVKDTLDGLCQLSRESSPEIRILKQIYFTSMFNREHGVNEAAKNTFSWILPTVSGDDERFDSTSDASSDSGVDVNDSSSLSDNLVEEDDRYISKDDETRGIAGGSSGKGEVGANPLSSRGGTKVAAVTSHPSVSEALDASHAEEVKKRLEASSLLMQWLRNENGVFHLSGKAGSGKSTLMKFIINNPRTGEQLRSWAGEEELVSANFFFWGSGDELQQSLEGLYRSILFEVLLQSPSLIPRVFPEAYRTFEGRHQAESIDQMFFKPNDFVKGFQRLTLVSSQVSTNFCLFVDGLDEYGLRDSKVDALEQQMLAETFTTWASQPNVKILASSRPHLQFQHAFAKTRQFHLHELVRPDITAYGWSLFGEHLASHPENLKGVQELLWKVSDTSQGVFLWAKLVLRTLLMSLERGDSFDTLESQLREIPDELDSLYQHLLASIRKVDRERALRLMFFVAYYPSHTRLNAIAVSWLEELDDPRFPMKLEFRPFDEAEIRKRQQFVRAQVSSLTQGLVEVAVETDNRGPRAGVSVPLFFKQRVQFFHRTALDFVRHSKEIVALRHRSRESANPNDRYARSHLAELYFADTDAVSYLEALPRTIGRGVSDDLVDNILSIIEHHTNIEPQCFRSSWWTTPLNLSVHFERWIWQPTSIFHLAATLGRYNYILPKIQNNPDHLRPENEAEFSLLLLCSIPGIGVAGKVQGQCCISKALIHAGASPHDLVKMRGDGSDSDIFFQVGRLFVMFYVCQEVARKQVDWLTVMRQSEHFSETLLHFVQAGVNMDCYITLGLYTEAMAKSARERGTRLGSAQPTHWISMEEFLRQAKPQHLRELTEYFPSAVKSNSWLSSLWCSCHRALGYESTSTASSTPPLTTPENLEPFSLDMIKHKGATEIDYPWKDGLGNWIVMSIQWADQTMRWEDVTVRMY